MIMLKIMRPVRTADAPAGAWPSWLCWHSQGQTVRTRPGIVSGKLPASAVSWQGAEGSLVEIFFFFRAFNAVLHYFCPAVLTCLPGPKLTGTARGWPELSGAVLNRTGQGGARGARSVRGRGVPWVSGMSGCPGPAGCAFCRGLHAQDLGSTLGQERV